MFLRALLSLAVLGALSAPLAAQTTYTLSVDLSRLIGERQSYAGLSTLLYAREQGARRQLTSAECGGAARPLRMPSNGHLELAGIRPSADCPTRQEYVFVVQGTSFPFRMPASNAALEDLLTAAVAPAAAVQCRTLTRAPADPLVGDCFFRAGGTDDQSRTADDDGLNNLTLYYFYGTGQDAAWHPAVPSTGGGGGPSRSNAQVEELARDAVGEALDGGGQRETADLTFHPDDAAQVIEARIKPGAVILADIAKDADDATKLRDAAGYRSALDLDQAVNDGAYDARLDVLEITDRNLHDETEHVARGRVVFTDRNIGYSVPGATSLPTTAADGDKVVWIIQDATDPDVECSNALSELVGKTAVTRDGLAIGSANAIRCDQGDDTYWLGIDSTGDPFAGSSEAGSIPHFVTISTHTYTGASAPTNLAYTAAAGQGTVTSDTGTDATIPAATGTNAGLLLPGEKARVGRIPAADCTQGQIWKRGSSAWACDSDATATGGTGLDQDAVDARVVAGTLAQARAGNADRWPANKLPVATTTGQDGIISTNDLAKLSRIEAGAEVNVQADWTETTTTADDYIQNKPDTITVEQQRQLSRIPTSACTNGQIWKANNAGTMTCQADATATGGTGIAGITISEGGTQSGAANEVTGLDFHNLDVSGTGASRTVTAEIVRVVSEVPESPYLDQRIILDAEDDFPGDYIDYGDADLTNTDGPVVRYDFVGAPANGPQYIECYSIEYGSSAADIARRGKCYIVTGGTYTMPADAQTRLWRSGTPATWREISDTAPVTGLTHWFEITGVGYADVSNTGHTYGRNFRSGESGGTWSYTLYTDQTLEAGDYTYAGRGQGTAGWIATPGTCDTWACRGNADRIPRAKLPREGFAPLIDGPGIGVSPTSSSSDTFRTNLNGFTPAFDLDTDLNEAAIIQVAGRFTLSGRSVTTIGFNPASTAGNEQVTADFSGLVRASTIAGSTVYDATTNRGVEVEGTAITIYNGVAALGEVAIWIGRDGSNIMGYVTGWDGTAQSRSFTVSVDLTMLVEHSDIGPAATTFVELSDTAATTGTDGQVPTWRAGELVNETPAAGGGGSSYTTHTSLATLPTSGMTVGDLHVVTQGTGVDAMVTRFIATSATQLKCVGGISEDLINLDFGSPASGGGQEVSVPTATIWHRLPIAGQAGQFHRWDFRFSQFLIVTGGINNTAGPWFNDRTWRIIDGAAVRNATAGTNGGAAAANQSVEVFSFYGNLAANWKRVRFGRMVDGSNAPWILVAIDDTGKQVFPLRIRGSCG